MNSVHAERRKTPRTRGKFRIFVSNDCWEGLQPLHTINVSAGGACILAKAEAPPVAGSSVLIKAGEELLVGVVAHVGTSNDPLFPGAAFGVSFFDARPNWWKWAVGAPPVSPPPAARVDQSETAQSLFLAGVGFLKQKNYVAARHKFEQAYKSIPDPCHLAMQQVCAGYQYLSTAFLSKAEESFTRAIQIAPACNEALVGLQEVAKRAARTTPARIDSRAAR